MTMGGAVQKKKQGVSSAKKRTWKPFSEYIRRKYANPAGFVQCYTCGKVKHYKDSMQCGHGFSGRGNSILFEEDVCRPQCYGCNCCSSGKLDVFCYNLRTELGDERYEELWRQKHTVRKFTVAELDAIHDYYMEKLEELNENN